MFYCLLQYGLRCVAIVVTACVANYWLSVVVIILFTLLGLFRHYFLHSSRNIQRLEALGNMHSFKINVLIDTYLHSS